MRDAFDNIFGFGLEEDAALETIEELLAGGVNDEEVDEEVVKVAEEAVQAVLSGVADTIEGKEEEVVKFEKKEVEKKKKKKKAAPVKPMKKAVAKPTEKKASGKEAAKAATKKTAQENISKKKAHAEKALALKVG